MSNVSLSDVTSFRNPPLTSSLDKTNQLQDTLTDEMKEAIKAIQRLNLTIEICGSWVWVFGSNSFHASKLRALNFKWAHKKRAWYLRPSNSKRRFHHQSWSMEKIRETHGSQAVQA